MTIAIPTYNNEKTISRAINSALNQDFKEEYEVLIANNASKDCTQDIINSFNDDRIRVIVNQETYDMYTNHNICLKEAKGDYILFCHSDDELLPNALAIVVDTIKKRKFPQRYILWGHSLFRDFNQYLQQGKQNVNTMFSGEAAIRCFLNGGLTPSGTCYSRNSLIEIGGFSTTNNMAPEMDWVMMVIAAFNCFEFEMLDRIFFKRMDASTAVRGMSSKEKIEIHKDAIEIMFSRLTDGQKQFFINQLLRNPSLNMLKSIKNYISRKQYVKGCIKSRLVSLLTNQ